MKMTKNTIKNLLNGEYMDALAGFASWLSTKKDMATALENLDNKVWEIAAEIDQEEQWLQIYSALMCGIEY
jgi:hypothetical protein